MTERLRVPAGHWKGPRDDVFHVPPPRGFGGFGIAHAIFPWLFLLLLAALVAVAIMALIRFSKRTPQGGAAVPPAAGGGTAGPDPALRDLRLRYARGEIDRDEYLQKSADLGDARPT